MKISEPVKSIYRDRSFKIVSNIITRRVSRAAFLDTKYKYSRCLYIIWTV